MYKYIYIHMNMYIYIGVWGLKIVVKGRAEPTK